MKNPTQSQIITDYRNGDISLEEILERSKEKNKYGSHSTKANIYWKAYCRIKTGDFTSPFPFRGSHSTLSVKFEKPIGG